MGAEVFVEPKFRRLKNKVRKAAELLLDFTGEKGSEVEIYLVGNSKMKKNILAYLSPRGFPRPDKKGRFLGEIYLNPDYIKKERLEIGNCPPEADPPLAEKLEIPAKLIYMLIHGFLHLLGYDHKRKNDTMKMGKKEKELLKLLR